MCAICGIVNKTSAPPSLPLLQTMTRQMRHRGPDDEGYRIVDNVGFGFQRLSIIDLALGHQPMTNEDDSLSLVFNGEIYNFQQLRADLEKTGRHRFKTSSDSEIILHLYEEHGERCVDHLRGMFAFAIWDQRQQTLFLARDRCGKKPLVYADTPNAFLFSSEINALLKHPDVTREIDYQAIDLYLTYQYVPSPWSAFKSIRKLPPAHYLIWKAGQIKTHCYWSPPFQPKTQLSFREAQDELMARLKESTRLRMIAEVPLGAFLSGGKDSSVVVGLMSELSSKPVNTFSIGFDEEKFSELPYARDVAKRFGCNHREFILRPNMLDLLPKLAAHYGEPYADSSALPSYFVSEVASQHVTVVLTGDGGDETLAGYPRYQAMKLLGRMGPGGAALRRALHAIISRLPDGTPPHSIVWRLKRLLGLGLDDARTLYLDTLCYFRESQKPRLYTPFMRERTRACSAPDYLNRLLAEAPSSDGIDPYLYADLKSYLPDCLMVKMDIAAMAHSLEARSPFLDHTFVEFTSSLPSHWKLKGLSSAKHILTDKVKGWLPDSVIKHKKQGFAIPMNAWFKGPTGRKMSEILLSERAVARNLFSKDEVKRLLIEHSEGKYDHSYELWALVMLEQWFLVQIDRV